MSGTPRWAVVAALLVVLAGVVWWAAGDRAAQTRVRADLAQLDAERKRTPDTRN